MSVLAVLAVAYLAVGLATAWWSLVRWVDGPPDGWDWWCAASYVVLWPVVWAAVAADWLAYLVGGR